MLRSLSNKKKAPRDPILRPIPLIDILENGDFHVNDEAAEVLSSIEGPVAVVAVCGLYRTGKSSMLNWLLNRQDGFTVGPTVQACTKGLWIWGEPTQHVLPNGETLNVVLLDSEGIGGTEASNQYDARIFSLATLICSTLVYNSLGSVDEAAISNLSFIANLTKHIKVRSSNDGAVAAEDGQEFQKFFPSFLWVVRDFVLDLVDEDGDPITPSEYLERALVGQSGYDKATMERNRVRQMMTAFFQDRQCVTLVRPINDETKLQQVDLLPMSEMRPEFQTQMKALRDQVFGPNIPPKKLHGRVLNGEMLVGLAKAYTDAINSGGVPTISSAWEGVTFQECRSAMQNAIEFFTEKMKEDLKENPLPLEQEVLTAIHEAAKKEAFEVYNSRAVGDSGSKFRVELEEKINLETDKVKEENTHLSELSCEALLIQLFNKSIQPKLSSASDDSGKGYASVEELRADFAKVREDYMEQSKGPAKLVKLALFVETKLCESMNILQGQLKEAYERKMRKLEESMNTVKEDLERERGAIGGYKSEMESSVQKFAEVKAKEVELERDVKEKAKTIEDLTMESAATRKLMEDFQIQAEKLKNELQKKSDELDAAQKEKELARDEVQMFQQENSDIKSSKRSQQCGCAIC